MTKVEGSWIFQLKVAAGMLLLVGAVEVYVGTN